jgi:ribonucleoside-diphosphate reductase alpha chain
MSFQSVSNSVYSSKYQLFDKHGNEIDESRSHSFMRVAHALAKNEKDVQYWADAFFAAMCNGAIPAGRIMGNAGAEEHKPNTSLINCVVADTIYDSIESIGQSVKDSLITLSGGSGIGYDFSTLRPKGSFVNGVGAQTSGPLPFADIFDKGCFTIASAGGRRGAQMAAFDLRHPDVLAFIKAKREDGRFRQFNISVLVSHSFFNEEKDWVFSFPIRNSDPTLDIAETLWDTWHVKDPAYITNEHGQTLFKIYGKMPKTELWDLILRSNYDYAEPGVIFIDRVNEENNLWFCENIRTSNPCVVAGTKVLTRDGYKSIETLVGQSVDVWNGYAWSQVEPKITGVDQKVVTVAFSNGLNLTCTEYHKFVLQDGSRCEAKDLMIGDKLQKHGFPVLAGTREVDLIEYYTQGFYSGDGSSDTNEIWLYDEKIDLIPHLKSRQVWVDKKVNRVQVIVDFDCRKKDFVPDNTVTVAGRLAWFAGLVDSDGSRSCKEGGISISSIDESFLQKVALLLNTLGVSPSVALMKKSEEKLMPNGKGGSSMYLTKDCYRLTVSVYETAQLLELGLMTKRVDLSCSPNRNAKRFVQIVSIVDAGIADLVYCFNEEKNHTAIFNGVMTAQCGEQTLPPNNSCLLGSIDLTQFVDQPFTDNASFNFELFANTVEVFTRMLDNVVEFNNLPLQAQRDEIIRKRRHGMGFFGLGSALILLGIRYDSSQALEFAEKVTKLMAIRGYVTGCALAEEKGSAPVLDEYFEITPEIVKKNASFKGHLGQKVKGIELFLASPYMQRLLADEPVLKDRLLQHGCRFSHHTSIAPTGTISLAFGNNTSGGVEPSFSHQYFRNLTVQDKKTRQQEAVYSKEFLLYKELYGQNKTDEELLKHLPDYFVTADTISWKAHVDMVAVVQKWVDSSISKTVNTPTNITLEEFKGIYDYAYEVGCKAVSTFRYNPETLGSILSRSEDLANSRYEFKLADGTVVQCAGGDRVEYDGEVTTAENLFSALKENTYGKF